MVLVDRSCPTKRALDRGDSWQILVQSCKGCFAGNGVFKSRPQQITQTIEPQIVLREYGKTQEANGSMENIMGNRWLWKVIMIPACLVLTFGLLGALYPDIYMDFYLGQSANTTLETMSETQPEISLLLEVIFRANGLGMIMSGILAVFIILFAFRKGRRWSVPALVIAGGIGLIGEIILEIMILQ